MGESWLKFSCYSGATDISGAQFIGVNSENIPSSPTGVATGPLFITLEPTWRMVVENRESSEPSLTINDQGVYTCRIPDENGVLVDVNMGIYPHGFSSEL